MQTQHNLENEIELVKLEIENIETILSHFDFKNPQSATGEKLSTYAEKQLNLSIGVLSSYVYLISCNGDKFEELEEIYNLMNDLFLNGSDELIKNIIILVNMLKMVMEK